MTSHWFRNGTVYTVTSSAPTAESLVEVDGRIVFVGAEADAAPHLLSTTVEVDMDGGFLMPGFVDGHDHLISGAIAKMGVSLEGLAGRDEVIAAIGRYAAEHPELPVIRGFGWTQFTFGVGVHPQKSWLDEVTGDRPAIMHSYEVHDLWANSAALAAAGIDADTPDPDPPTCFYGRDADGAPSGLCAEGEAWVPVAAALGVFSVENILEASRRGLFAAPTWGITTTFDAGIILPFSEAVDEVWDRLLAVDRAEGLPVRVVGAEMVRDPAADPDVVVARLAELNRRVASDRLAVTTLKLFADGVGPQHTAALLEPYHDTPGFAGEPFHELGGMTGFVVAANRAGFDVHIHACGDGAVRLALDAIEAAAQAVPDAMPRNTVCHLELAHPADLARFAELGVTANGTPLWGTDYRGEFIDAYPELVGEERFAERYLPYASVLGSGALLTFGADCPGVEVHEIAPLIHIEAAVTRRRPGHPDDRVCGPDQRITLADAIRCYTVNGARALRLEHEIGTLEVGKRSDLVQLSTDPFTVADHEIHSIAVARTMLGGRFTHQGV